MQYCDTSHIVKPKPVQAEESPSFNPGDYVIIGKLHSKKDPKAAKSLLDDFNTAKAKSLDTDFHNLNFYYLQFCKLNDAAPTDYLGDIHKRDRVEARKVFIASMLRIYRPQIFTHDINIGNGLGELLCIILRYDKGAMSRIVAEVILWVNKDYDGFAERVNFTVAQLVAAKNGYAGDLFKEVA